MGEFDSEIEYARYIFLRSKSERGEIKNLHRQVEYELIPKQTETIIKHLKTKDKEEVRVVERPCVYRADFVYDRGQETIVEDVKGSTNPKFSTATQDFKIKKKLMLYRYGIKINIVTRATEWK